MFSQGLARLKVQAVLIMLMGCLVMPYAIAQDNAVKVPEDIMALLASESTTDKMLAIEKLAVGDLAHARLVLKSLDNGEVLLPDGTAVVLNNRARRFMNEVLAGLNLFDDRPEIRLAAAQTLQKEASDNIAPLLAKALEKEHDENIKVEIVLALSKINLRHADPKIRLVAVNALAQAPSQSVRSLLTPLTQNTVESDGEVRIAAREALNQVNARLALGEHLSSVFSGVSLGSILLLAALGLAITYGVMGVINMAHGEMIMVGAYATYCVQTVFRQYFPAYLEAYILFALPVAFLMAALVGAVVERAVICHLYGRPLESLLATWGLSLILIQAARMIFGAQNVELANPQWMSGNVEVFAGLVLPWNRIAIIVFSLSVLLLVWLLMNQTRMGMFIRAVTQNRQMANCVGVSTKNLDTLAFALGSGIAGLGGVALSQIANVGPDMGQGYIIDSFMVVVLGGVGQIAGSVMAALGLGVMTKFIEGWSGAVVAKIAVLLLIIAFIQKRPQGLFALKGRMVD